MREKKNLEEAPRQTITSPPVSRLGELGAKKKGDNMSDFIFSPITKKQKINIRWNQETTQLTPEFIQVFATSM